MQNQPSICILFTKQFPFGHHENYILHEIPYLFKYFDRVIVVPYDEFNYEDHRLKANLDSRLEIFKINKIHPQLGVAGKIKREIIIRFLLISEIFRSREWKLHLKNFKKLIGGLRHLYHSSIALTNFISKEQLTPQNSIFYHYWLHRGVMISMMARRFHGAPEYINVSRGHTRDMYHKSWNAIVDRHDFFLPYEKTKWDFLDRVFPISEHALRFVGSVLPQHLHKASVSRLGVYSFEKPVYHPPLAIKQVVTCSFADDNKRNHLLPEILKHLPYKIKWTHFGSAVPGVREQLEKLCAEHADIIEFDFRGPTPNADILKFYRENRVDLFFTLSKVESLPVSLMEAAAAGIPMVSTSVVATPEIVNESNGYLMPVDFDPKQVADRISEIFVNEELWKKKSQSARLTFEERFDADKNFNTFCNELRNILEQNKIKS